MAFFVICCVLASRDFEDDAEETLEEYFRRREDKA